MFYTTQNFWIFARFFFRFYFSSQPSLVTSLAAFVLVPRIYLGKRPADPHRPDGRATRSAFVAKAGKQGRRAELPIPSHLGGVS